MTFEQKRADSASLSELKLDSCIWTDQPSGKTIICLGGWAEGPKRLHPAPHIKRCSCDVGPAKLARLTKHSSLSTLWRSVTTFLLFSVQIFFPQWLSYSPMSDARIPRTQKLTNEIWHTFEGWPFLPSMKSSQQSHILPIVTVAIAKQNDCFYASASIYDGFYSVRDGFTIASVSTIIATDESEMNT